MSDPATEPATPAAPALTKEADPEIASVKQLLKLLDKTAKSTRTYGFTNSVAQKFFQQLHEGLTGHLTTYHALGFLIQRSELYFREETVYQTESSRDNLAFKLYADGIRELTFHEGLTQEDLTFFLSALWDGEEPGEEDDDIVTRLWAKNMTSITIITAEEIVKASGAGDVLTLQTDGTMNEPTSSLREMVAQEKTRATAGGAGSGAQSRFQSGSIGYEVSEAEQSALAKVVEEESSRDNTMYVLDMLTAILASEQSPALLTKLFDVFGGVLEVLTQQGNWTVLEHVLSLLHETEAMRPDLSDAHKAQLLALFETLRRPERIKLIETYLNNAPTANTQGLLTLLLLMNSQAIQALCALLANLQVPAHQAIVCEVLTTLARETPEPLLRGLSDRRAPYVRNLLSIISKWNNPHLAEAVEKVIRYPDPVIRKEVLRTLGILRPQGNGSKLLVLLNDPEETVRHALLKLLMSGQYTAPFTAWSSVVTSEEFQDRTTSEKRAVFQAMRQATGDEAVPYWQHLLTERSWTNRKKVEELALLAAESLGKLATPAAVAALDHGQKKAGATVRQACTTALAMASKQQRLKPAVGDHK